MALVADRALVAAACSAREIASARFLANRRVTLIDVGWKISAGRPTGELAVRVHVGRKPTGRAFDELARKSPHAVIDVDRIPFPTDIIEATYPTWRDGPQGTWEVRARRFDPIVGGISISNEWSGGFGTLGAVVRDRASGEPMLLSAWHVLAETPEAPRGLRILQPAYADGGRARYVVGRLERHAMDRGLDAALARLSGDRRWSDRQLGIGALAGAAMPALGMRVRKSGRASGLTAGVVDGIDADYPVRYLGGYRRVGPVCRIVPAAPGEEVSRGGDSGATWVAEGTALAAGLHFAGQDAPETALAMAFPRVLEALAAEIPAPHPAPAGLEAVVGVG